MELKKKETDATYWHPAFFAGIQIELEEDADNLVFENEHQLGTKPMEIDVLIIKKEKDRPVKKNIGRIFRKYNIVEYKSPEDHLDIDVFYKTGAYGSLYKSFGETVDERAADDITITIIRDAKPEGLFRYFKEHGIRMTNPYQSEQAGCGRTERRRQDVQGIVGDYGAGD